MKRSLVSAVLTLSLSASFTTSAFTATKASITIDQVSAKSLGMWTLLTANGASYSSAEKGVSLTSHSLALSDFGPVTLSVTSPQGMSARISIYRGGDLLKTIDTPQYSFTLYPNDQYRFLVQYTLDRTGTLGVTSDPSGIRMRIKGSGTRTFTAVTPHTFTNIPAGQYAVVLSSVPGCLQPRTESIIVQPEQRNTLAISLNCTKNQTGSSVSSYRPTKRALVEYAQTREYNPRGNRK